MLATVICPVQPVATSSQVQAVFRSIHWQSWSETVRSKCSHSCGTTRFNFGKHKVEDTFWSQQTRLPQVDMGCKKTSNRVATITSQSTTDDLQQSSNQYQHGCEVQLNIPGKQLRLWTAGDYRCSLGEQTLQTRCITSQSRSKYVVARPSRMYSHGILFTKICIHVSASVAMSQTTIENCIGGHVNVLSVYGKT